MKNRQHKNDILIHSWCHGVIHIYTGRHSNPPGPQVRHSFIISTLEIWGRRSYRIQSLGAGLQRKSVCQVIQVTTIRLFASPLDVFQSFHHGFCVGKAMLLSQVP